MTFSKYIKYALLAFFLLTLCACDEIDEQDRFQKVEIASGGESGGEGGGEGTGFGAKNVLIEDFTGQRCINCPLATNTISTLQASFGHDRVIPVAIHGGDLTLAAPTGLANEIGNTYTAERGVSSKPKGEVDRTGQLLDQEKWGTTVLERIAMTAHVELGVENIAFDADTRELSFNVNAAADLTGAQGLLQVWLTESHIIKSQATPDHTPTQPSPQLATTLVSEFHSYAHTYSRKDRRMALAAAKHFDSYISRLSTDDTSSDTDPNAIASGFLSYLYDSLNGNTPANYFKKFREFLDTMLAKGIVTENAARNLSLKYYDYRVKSILTLSDIHRLETTPCRSDGLKRAFLFAHLLADTLLVRQCFGDGYCTHIHDLGNISKLYRFRHFYLSFIFLIILT